MKEILAVYRKRKITTKLAKIDLNDPRIWWNKLFVQTEAGLLEIVRSLNRSWTYDS